MKKFYKNKKVLIRNPESTRPWQHVLEAVCGYLLLALNLKKNDEILVPNLTFVSCVSAMLLANLKVVLCEVNEDNYSIYSFNFLGFVF